MKSVHHCLRSAAWAITLGMTSLLAQAGAPDVVHGEQVYARCLACHALAMDRVGPHHCGLIGRRAGVVPSFDYSPAMKKSGLVWNEKTLNLFLKKPLKLVPGTSMTYDGVPDATDRADLIAYLKKANSGPECHPSKESPTP